MGDALLMQSAGFGGSAAQMYDMDYQFGVSATQNIVTPWSNLYCMATGYYGNQLMFANTEFVKDGGTTATVVARNGGNIDMPYSFYFTLNNDTVTVRTNIDSSTTYTRLTVFAT